LDDYSSLQFTSEDLILCYSSFDSLFRNKTEILIEHKNVLPFYFIAQFLRNPYLLLICNKVTSTKSKHFSFTSEHLGDISIKQLPFMNNCNLIINHKSFEINSSHLSCISTKFHSIGNLVNHLIFSIPEEHLFCFESFLSIFKGSSFRFDEFDASSLIYLIDFFDLKSLLQFISDSLPLPSNIEESIEFLSKIYSKILGKHFQQSIDIVIDNFEKITIDQFLQISNEILLSVFLFTKTFIFK
jgi:hypothetical protein